MSENLNLAEKILYKEDCKLIDESFESIVDEFKFEDDEFISHSGLKPFEFINWRLSTYLQGDRLASYLEEKLKEYFIQNSMFDLEWKSADIWVNSVSIDEVTNIFTKQGIDKEFDIIVFETDDKIEHHIQRNNITEVLGTFYDYDGRIITVEKDITQQILSL